MSKISIITISYNNKEGLSKTINSVLNQSYKYIEYLVIDGGSNDGTVDLLKSYDSDIDHWVSESDKGIYNAMNKGIQAASGEYLLFLNSGDVLLENSTIEKASQGLCADIVYGDLVINKSGVLREKRYPDILTFEYLWKSHLPHPASFIKKELFQRCGLYNENNKIVSDQEFFITALIKGNASYKHLNFPITKFEFDGISSKDENRNLIKQERVTFFNKHFPLLITNFQELDHLKKIQSSRVVKKALKFRKVLTFFKNKFS
ncbi:glycosyltransferase family 2 protein [Marivirga sp.]|uniref:glycosyltransferase family 2 protein n=1 Tax=Marivirga sp. TaxID=2018662 RepID=UPI0025FC41B2|nr:glycosyltransferase family 2 protein [Marivirga sp.]